MKKKNLEISISVASVAVFILLIATSNFLSGRASAGFGYMASLLVFFIIMGIAGIKLAAIPDK